MLPNRLGDKGVALMITLFAILFMTFLAVEIGYDTNVEYVVSTNDFNKVRAYYAAKSGIELGLLRVQLFRNIVNQYGDNLKGQMEMVNQIWKFPFMWPPVLPAEMTVVDKDSIKDAVKESLMQSSYDLRIESESNKIDINDLDSQSKTMRDNTRKFLFQLIRNRLDQDDDWAKNHKTLDVDQILNNIHDWISSDENSTSGGDRRNKYPDIKSDFIPPGRPFKTFEELRMVAGVDDEIYKLLIPQITIYGGQGINVNTASKEVLMSIHPTINSDLADEILKHIGNPDEGPFNTMDQFISFIGNRANVQEIQASNIPLYFGAEFNFRLTSIGSSGKAQSKIIAIVYDFDTVKQRLKDLLDKETPTATPTPPPGTVTAGQPPGPTPSPTPAPKPPLMGKPRVVYWYEE